MGILPLFFLTIYNQIALKQIFKFLEHFLFFSILEPVYHIFKLACR